MKKTRSIIFKDKKDKLKNDNISEYGYTINSYKNNLKEDYSKVYKFVNKTK